MIEDGANSNPIIAVVCFFGYIIISCIIAWIMCFITASREGRRCTDPSICLTWPIFVIMAPFVAVVAIWLLLRWFLLKHRISRIAVDILTLPFRPTELGMRLYIRREIRKLTKLKKEEKNNEQ